MVGSHFLLDVSLHKCDLLITKGILFTDDLKPRLSIKFDKNPIAGGRPV